MKSVGRPKEINKKHKNHRLNLKHQRLTRKKLKSRKLLKNADDENQK